jgi:hypothetical protein
MPNLTQAGQNIGQSSFNNIDPNIILRALLGASQVSQGALGQLSSVNPTFALPEAMIKGANKFLSKLGEKNALEASMVPGGLANMKQVIDMNTPQNEPPQTNGDNSSSSSPDLSSLLTPQSSASREEPQQAQSPQGVNSGITPQVSPEAFDALSKLLISLGAGLTAAGGGNPSGILGLAESQINRKATDEGRHLENQLKQQELLGLKPLQAGEREKAGFESQKESAKQQFQIALEDYKQNRLDDRERLKSELKGTDIDTQTIELAKNSALNLVNLRSKVFLKGPGLGQIGSVASFFGAGTEGRAEFDSAANQFVFDVGNILGQKGRAFTEKEQKLVREKVIQASLSAKASDFNGRMKAVFSRINQMAGSEILSESDLKPKSRRATQSKSNQASSSGKLSTGMTFTVES